MIARLALPLLMTVLLGGCGASSIDANSPSALSLGVERSENAAIETSATSAADGPSTREVAEARRLARQMTESADPESRSYKIGPMDVLEVTVFKVSELSRSVQVSEAGSINFPLVGDMPAAGRTAGEVERDLTQRLGARYLQNPQVTVQVREFNSQRVTIEGSVKKPGVYPIQGRLTLLQALATAGGFTELATSTVVVFRTTDGQRAGARFDLDEIRAGTTPDPELKAGDVVVASDSSGKVAFENFAKVLPIARFFMLF